MAAVTNQGCALYHASDALRRDREVVLTAVSNDRQALGAAEEFRDDREVVLTAMSNDNSSGGSPLQHASDRLRNDPLVVLAAVASGSVWDLKDASEALRQREPGAWLARFDVLHLTRFAPSPAGHADFAVVVDVVSDARESAVAPVVRLRSQVCVLCSCRTAQAAIRAQREARRVFIQSVLVGGSDAASVRGARGAATAVEQHAAKPRKRRHVNGRCLLPLLTETPELMQHIARLVGVPFGRSLRILRRAEEKFERKVQVTAQPPGFTILDRRKRQGHVLVS